MKIFSMHQKPIGHKMFVPLKVCDIKGSWQFM